MDRLLLAAALAIWLTPPASASKPLTCPPRWGKLGKPLVSTPETARAIFLAVERDFYPRPDKLHFPDVEVDDSGRWWSVFRSNSPKPADDAEIELSAGGGQLSMRIDKCDGRIWHVYRTR